MTRITLASIVIFSLVIIGCGSDREVNYKDDGLARIGPADTAFTVSADIPVALEADRELEVMVELTDCAAFCIDIESSSCTATLEGDRIEVTAEARTIEKARCDRPACRSVIASCSLGTLPAGDYDLSYGGRVSSFSIPTDNSPVVGTRN